MTHTLKTWPQYYYRIDAGEKTFEVRKNDRDFQTGDNLELLYFDPTANPNDPVNYHDPIYCTVEYILHGGQFGIEPGYVVMAIKKIE